MLDPSLTYQFSEVSIISKIEVGMSLLSPFAIPITGLIMGEWLPKYFILVIIYFLCLLGVYKLSEVINRNKILVISMLLLLFNVIGIYLSVKLATSI